MNQANNLKPIIVQGKKYYWQVQHKPTSRSAIAQRTFYLWVESVERNGKALIVDLLKSRRSSCLNNANASIKPQDVSAIINYALQKGWKADEPGLTFRLNYSIR